MYINFTGDANEQFKDTGKTYADIVSEGIEQKWTTAFSGTNYDFVSGIKGNKVTEVISIVSGQQRDNTEQKYIQFKIDTSNESWYDGILLDCFGENHVSNFNRNGAEDNWSISGPKNITLYKYDSRNGYVYNEEDLKAVAAHEFGHALGLEDAYTASIGNKVLMDNDEVYDGEWAVSGDIMYHQGEVLANDVEMVLNAFKTNKCQYFINNNGHMKSSVIRLPQQFENK